MEIIYLILLFLGGFLAGLYGSTVGSGGLVTFPIVLLTGLPIHAAVATNRFGAVFLELFSALRFYKEKHLKLKHAAIFGLIAALGSFIGANLVIQIDEKHLNLTVAILLVTVFSILLFKNKLGLSDKKISKKHWATALIMTFLLGIYGGFFGVGFGTFINFVFVLIGLNFINSAAMSRMVGLSMSLVATAVFIYSGAVNFEYGIALAIGQAIGAWIGAGIGIKKGVKFVRALFLIILLATVIKLVLSFIN